MNPQSKSWKFWSREPYPASCPAYQCGPNFGTTEEPGSSMWCAALLDPIRESLKTPFILLDWGCGDGRLFNFLSKRFKMFRYYGLERPGVFGTSCVKAAQESFGHDLRGAFGVYDSILESCAIEAAQVAVLGSVATHIPFPDFEAVMKRLLPILMRGGVVVSSFFIEEKYEIKNGTCYGHDDCWGWVSYTQAQINDLCRKMGLVSKEGESFVTMGCTHRILRFQKGPA